MEEVIKNVQELLESYPEDKSKGLEVCCYMAVSL